MFFPQFYSFGPIPGRNRFNPVYPLDGLYDNLARRQEKDNRRKLRAGRIDEYEEYTWTGPSTAITIFGT